MQRRPFNCISSLTLSLFLCLLFESCNLWNSVSHYLPSQLYWGASMWRAPFQLVRLVEDVCNWWNCISLWTLTVVFGSQREKRPFQLVRVGQLVKLHLITALTVVLEFRCEKGSFFQLARVVRVLQLVKLNLIMGTYSCIGVPACEGGLLHSCDSYKPSNRHL